MNTHYHYGSGSHGCLYDNGPHYAATLETAVEDLAFTFDLSEGRTEVLRNDCYLELEPEDGAAYCEITQCNDDCNPEDFE